MDQGTKKLILSVTSIFTDDIYDWLRQSKFYQTLDTESFELDSSDDLAQ